MEKSFHVPPDCAADFSCEPLGKPFHKSAHDEPMFRTLLGFELKGSTWEAMPQRLFRPRGLMLWDVPPKAMVSQCLVGNQMQILCSWAPVPARFFTMGQSYERIKQLLAEGVEPAAWPDFDTMNLGNSARVEVTENGKPCRDCLVAMWGYTIH